MKHTISTRHDIGLINSVVPLASSQTNVVETTGAPGVTPTTPGVSGTYGGGATAIAQSATAATNIAIALGGNGGDGNATNGNDGNGGNSGAALAKAITTQATGNATADAYANTLAGQNIIPVGGAAAGLATGGLGGSAVAGSNATAAAGAATALSLSYGSDGGASVNGKGGAGGASTALSSANAPGGTATSDATSYGGLGGSGGTAGNGGAATASASAKGLSSATADATATGGAAGTGSATGGKGGNANATASASASGSFAIATALATPGSGASGTGTSTAISNAVDHSDFGTATAIAAGNSNLTSASALDVGTNGTAVATVYSGDNVTNAVFGKATNVLLAQTAQGINGIGDAASASLTLTSFVASNFNGTSTAIGGTGAGPVAGGAASSTVNLAGTGLVNADAAAFGGAVTGGQSGTAVANAAFLTTGSGSALATATGGSTNQGDVTATASGTLSVGGKLTSPVGAPVGGSPQGTLTGGSISVIETATGLSNNASPVDSVTVNAATGAGSLGAASYSAPTANAVATAELLPTGLGSAGSVITADLTGTGGTALAAGVIGATDASGAALTVHDTAVFKVNLATVPLSGTLVLGVVGSNLANFTHLQVAASEREVGTSLYVTLTVNATESASGGAALLDFALGVTSASVTGTIGALNDSFGSAGSAAAVLTADSVFGLGTITTVSGVSHGADVSLTHGHLA